MNVIIVCRRKSSSLLLLLFLKRLRLKTFIWQTSTLKCYLLTWIGSTLTTIYFNNFCNLTSFMPWSRAILLRFFFRIVNHSLFQCVKLERRTDQFIHSKQAKTKKKKRKNTKSANRSACHFSCVALAINSVRKFHIIWHIRFAMLSRYIAFQLIDVMLYVNSMEI